MKDQLETIIDKHGLKSVLSAIAEICSAKAEHVRSAWQDETLAKEWDRSGKMIDTIAAKITL